MIASTRRQQPNPSIRRDSIVVEICGEEDLTVIDNPPGFPSDEELRRLGICPETGDLIGTMENCEE